MAKRQPALIALLLAAIFTVAGHGEEDPITSVLDNTAKTVTKYLSTACV